MCKESWESLVYPTRRAIICNIAWGSSTMDQPVDLIAGPSQPVDLPQPYLDYEPNLGNEGTQPSCVCTLISSSFSNGFLVG